MLKIARDKNGTLMLYDCDIIRSNDVWKVMNDGDSSRRITDFLMIRLPSKMFPELQWENEPMEIEIIPKHCLNSLNQFKDICAFYRDDYDNCHILEVYRKGFEDGKRNNIN